MIQEIIRQTEKNLKKIKKTPFDDFDIKLDRSMIGGNLRDRLAVLTGYQATISSWVGWFILLEAGHKARKKQAKSLALKKAQGSSSIERESIAENMKVEIEGKETTYYDEWYQEIVNGYYATLGKYKLKELENNLEIGRSLLSWDKAEAEKGM